MASYSCVVFTLCVSSLLGKTYLVQATTCTDGPVSGFVFHSLGVLQSPAITILLRYFDMGLFLYILAAVLVVEYTFDGSSLLLYLFIYY